MTTLTECRRISSVEHTSNMEHTGNVERTGNVEHTENVEHIGNKISEGFMNFSSLLSRIKYIYF